MKIVNGKKILSYSHLLVHCAPQGTGVSRKNIVSWNCLLFLLQQNQLFFVTSWYNNKLDVYWCLLFGFTLKISIGEGFGFLSFTVYACNHCNQMQLARFFNGFISWRNCCEGIKHKVVKWYFTSLNCQHFTAEATKSSIYKEMVISLNTGMKIYCNTPHFCNISWYIGWLPLLIIHDNWTGPNTPASC